MGLAFDSKGNLYVADARDQVIRVITPAREVKTFAGLAGHPGHSDGQGAEARFASPIGIAIDASDNLYVTDGYNETIRKINPSAFVTTIAGVDGQAGGANGDRAHAMFDHPRGIAIDANGNLYIAARNAIREISATGEVRTLAGNPRIIALDQESYGDGIGQLARFKQPAGVALDIKFNVYVADTDNSVIRKIDSLGWVTTIAGTPGMRGHVDGSRAEARFDHPQALVIDSNGDILVAACGNSSIRRITVDGGAVSMGPMGCAHGIAIGPDGAIYLSNAGISPGVHVPGSIIRVTRLAMQSLTRGLRQRGPVIKYQKFDKIQATKKEDTFINEPMTNHFKIEAWVMVLLSAIGIVVVI